MTEKKTGKVYLVGAGPGDPGLLTLKGKRILGKADVVVYDALIGQGILAMIPCTAERIDAGKRANRHTMQQEEINALLAEKAREGKCVVRLQGGDPFLFGRGGEEMEYLAGEGIPYEAVPGVTSALSVPAYQGIPLTHRDCSSSVHILSGHERPDGTFPFDFDALIRAGGTLVFLMGGSSAGKICRELLDAGINPETPSAVLMNGTAAGQRMVSAKISAMAENCSRERITTPAMLLVGEVCSYAGRLSWTDHLPLFGVKILLLRPQELITETAEALADLGAEVLAYPVIRTDPVKDPAPLDTAFSGLQEYQWIAFTSRIGVQRFFSELLLRGLDVRALCSLKFAVIGPGTKAELKKYGIAADLMPEIYDTVHLAEALSEAASASERILLARSKQGSAEFAEHLAGPELTDLPIYETNTEETYRKDLQKACADGTIGYVVFTSASIVKSFRFLTPEADLSAACAVCIGAQSAAAASALGMRTIVAKEATMECVIEAICRDHCGKEENHGTESQAEKTEEF